MPQIKPIQPQSSPYEGISSQDVEMLLALIVMIDCRESGRRAYGALRYVVWCLQFGSNIEGQILAAPGIWKARTNSLGKLLPFCEDHDLENTLLEIIKTNQLACIDFTGSFDDGLRVVA